MIEPLDYPFTPGGGQNRRTVMALEDYFESEVGIAVAATAVLLSPRVRGLVRKGVVTALAGAIRAG
ncbi:MAG: hypothetical protein JOZ41_05840, partial [Chloroflexi bacterium]|nr:hypothetical protein [Chloroflexota bacterium]